MTKHSAGLIMRVPDPFDGSAEARLSHMGLLDQSGQVEAQSMEVFTCIFAGLFFDDLCDFYDDRDKLVTIYHTFQELAEKQDHQHMLLLLSLQYDYLRKPLPDPVWWLSGHSEAVKIFMSGFLGLLGSLMTQAGFFTHKAVKGGGGK